MQWPPSDSDLEKLGIAHCTRLVCRRKTECLCFHYATNGTLEGEVMVDLNKTLPWQLGQSFGPVAACLVSSTTPWLMRVRRPAMGVETLLLQGFDLDDILDENQLCPFPESTLLKLAGNMMSGQVLAAIFIATFTCIDWHLAMKAYNEFHGNTVGAVEEVGTLSPQPWAASAEEDDSEGGCEIVTHHSDSGESMLESDGGM